MDTPSSDTSLEALTEAELAAVLEAQAQAFAVLLYASDLPPEIQQAIIELLPILTPEQLTQLFEQFQNAYADQATRRFDEQTATQLQQTAATFTTREQQLERELETELRVMHEQLSELATS